MFDDAEDPWLLQEDNDPKHTLKKAKNWREENRVERMEWPAQSPDLNSIENVWALLKIKVNNREPKKVKDSKTIIRKEWGDLQLEYAQNLVSSVPKRLNRVLANKGDFCLY